MREDNLDVVLTAPAGRVTATVLEFAEVSGDGAHPRAVRTRRYRRQVRIWETAGGEAVLVLGRGLAGRWAVAFEVAPGARGRNLGRRPAETARALVPDGEDVSVQVAPGNVPSLRAVLAAGFVPVGAEILFPEVA